eukprot:9082450-Pyramimonas_sp.AAC.1
MHHEAGEPGARAEPSDNRARRRNGQSPRAALTEGPRGHALGRLRARDCSWGPELQTLGDEDLPRNIVIEAVDVQKPRP